MDRDLIDRYIVLPMVINVFKQDKDNFNKFKMRNIYHDLLDAAIDKASTDFYNLKRDIISEHHLDIKRIDELKYTVSGEVIEYTAEELKELTNEMMKHYIRTVEVEWKERMWE